MKNPKKKTIRIDFRHYWWHFNPENNIFINLLKKDYNVIIDKKNPDYVFYSVFTPTRPIHKHKSLGKRIENFSPKLYKLLRDVYYFKKDRWKMPIIKGDFAKIFFTVENAVPKMDKVDWAFTHTYDEELKNPRHMRIPGYAFNSVRDPKELIKNLKEKDLDKIMFEKKKFCVFICSNDVHFRNRFFKKLNKYKKVESWGKVLNNMGRSLPKVVEENKDKVSKGETKEYVARNFLAQYKFTIAFENTSKVGYTSERKVEPMRAYNIPIYWGNPLVYRDFNTKSFINYHDFEKNLRKRLPNFFFKIPLVKWLSEKYVEEFTFRNMIEKIKELDQSDELYREMLKQPWYNDNKPPIYLNKERIRKRLREIVESGRQI